MMTVKIQGGLGNQLHCLAFGLALMKKNEGRVAFDFYSSFLNDEYDRICLLDYFPRLIPEIRKNLQTKLSGISPSGFFAPYADQVSRVISKFLPLKYKFYEVEGEPYRYRGELLYTHFLFNITFQGYWACHGYCVGIEEQLNKLLWLPEPEGPITSALLTQIKSCNSCFIHFRSYKEESGMGERASMRAYYTSAMELVLQGAPDTTFYVFSDDIDIAKTQLPDLDAQLIFVDNPEAVGNKESLNDFYLMRSCKNGIVGNSTFSWWAAWLLMQVAKDKVSLIIAPAGVSPWGVDWMPSEWTAIDAYGEKG